MQSAFTNICEKMGGSEELSEFRHGSVIGCQLCNKSACKIISLLNIPLSIVIGIIGKWKHLGTAAAGKDHVKSQRGITECMVSKSHQCPADSIAEEF